MIPWYAYSSVYTFPVCVIFIQGYKLIKENAIFDDYRDA